MDLTNEEQLANILKKSGKPWILDILEVMERTGITPNQLIQSMYHVANVRRFARWGSVSWIIQDGQIKLIKQEQQTKFE